jgi:hypothetical protein
VILTRIPGEVFHTPEEAILEETLLRGKLYAPTIASTRSNGASSKGVIGSSEQGQLFEGLRALASLTQKFAEYKKLKLKHPYIWPTQIIGGTGEKLRWAPEASI